MNKGLRSVLLALALVVLTVVLTIPLSTYALWAITRIVDASTYGPELVLREQVALFGPFLLIMFVGFAITIYDTETSSTKNSDTLSM